MVDNTGFISTLGATPTAQIDDATDAIHSSIIMSLNAATGENRPIEGFNIVQATSSSHTSYAVTAGDVLRNGLRVDVSAATLTTDSSTGTSNSVDWYGLIVVNSSNALAWRHGTSSPTSTGKLDTSNATVAALTAGDIPIAIVKYAASSNANLTNRPMQFLGYAQATRGFSAVNSNAETMRINADGTLTKGSATITLPSTTGTLARTADNITGTAAGLSSTLAVSSGGTGATDSNAWLNSRITTSADGSLNYDATTAVAVNHDNLAGFVAAEHYRWDNDISGTATIHANNRPIADDSITYAKIQNVSADERILGRVSGADGVIEELTQAQILTFLGNSEAGATADQTAVEIIGLLNSDLGGNFTIGNQSDDTATFTGGVSVGGSLAVTGDLNITGDINSVSVTDLDVDDLTITVASGAADSATADGAGLIIDGASASFTYSDSGTKFVANKSIEATSFIGNLTGNPTIGTKSDNVAYDLIFEDSGGLFQDSATGNITYNPTANELTTVSLTATGQSKGGTVAGTTRVYGGASSLQAAYFTGNLNNGSGGAGSAVTRNPVFEGYGSRYAESRLIIDSAIESSYSDDADQHGVGGVYSIETQHAQHRAGLVINHDDDTSNANDYAWGIGKQFNSSGVGTDKFTIGIYDGKNYDDTFLTNTNQNVFRSENAALTIDSSKNVSLANGLTIGDSSSTTAGTLRYGNSSSTNLQYYDGSNFVTLATTASSARTVTAGGNTLGASETLAFTAGTGITIAENAGAVTITNSVTDTNTNIATTDLIAGLGAESGIHITADHLVFTDATDNTSKKITLTQLMAAVTHPLIPTLPADKIDSGTFATARIPTLAQSKVTDLATDLAAKVPATRTIAGRALSNNLVVRVNATSGKLEVNDGSNTTTIQDTAGTPVDVVFDNRKTEYDEIQDANSTKPADNATVGARLGTNLKAADGSTTLGDADVKNASIASSHVVGGGKLFASTLPEDGATTGKLFFQAGVPTAKTVGDLWFDSDDSNRMYIAASATADQITSGEWESIGFPAGEAGATSNSTEATQDIVGAMLASNTETLITATYQDGDGTIDLVVDNDLSNYDNSSSGFITATLTTEQVQDIVGAMFSSNTETRISATYEDGDGTIDLVVDDMTANTTYSAGTGLSLSGTTFSTNLSASEIPNLAASKITSGEFATARIADDAITSAKIADDAIITALIADDAITSALIADDAIITALIADDAITDAHIGAAQIIESHIKSTNTPTDNYLLSYDASSSGFTWVDGATAGGSNQTITTGSGIDGADSGSSDNITLALGIQELSDVQIASGDKLLVLDSDGSTHQLESIDDIATLFAGSNLTATSGVLAVDDAFLKNDANDTTTGIITAGGFTTAGSITLGGHAVDDIDVTSEASDADDHLMTALAIKNRIEDYSYTTNTGTVTSVGTNTGLSGTVTGSGSLSLALGDLADMTQSWDNTADEFIVLDGGTQKRKLSSEIFGSNAFNSTTIPTNNNQLTNGASFITASSSDTLTNKTIAVSQVTEISNLTAAEGEQLENIGTTTITAAQWGYLGAASGAITNTDTVDMGDGFTVTATTAGTNSTITEGDTLTIAAGTGITTTATNDGTITVANTLTSNATHTGDVTGATALTIANNAVTLAKMATMATDSFLGRTTDNAGNVEVLSKSDALAILNVEDGATADQTATEIIGLLNSDLGGNFTIGNQSDDTATFTGPITASAGLSVTGHVDATTKSFVIPHPTKENMTLRHGSLEGPEYGVYHRGRLIDDSTIALPEYWLGLVDESTITVQLTANGNFQMLYVDKIENNTVYIDNATDSNIDCFYIIHGERKDIGKMEVEY